MHERGWHEEAVEQHAHPGPYRDACLEQPATIAMTVHVNAIKALEQPALAIATHDGGDAAHRVDVCSHHQDRPTGLRHDQDRPASLETYT